MGSVIDGSVMLGLLVAAVGVVTAPPWSTLPGMLAVFALIFGISFARNPPSPPSIA